MYHAFNELIWQSDDVRLRVKLPQVAELSDRDLNFIFLESAARSDEIATQIRLATDADRRWVHKASAALRIAQTFHRASQMEIERRKRESQSQASILQAFFRRAEALLGSEMTQQLYEAAEQDVA